MTDQPAKPTILDRLTTAYGEDKARSLLASGDVQLGGEQVTDPATPAPVSVGWVINPR